MNKKQMPWIISLSMLLVLSLACSYLSDLFEEPSPEEYAATHGPMLTAVAAFIATDEANRTSTPTASPTVLFIISLVPTATPPSRSPLPSEAAFVATFDPLKKSTFYTITVSDRVGSGLNYEWSNTNPCGQFLDADSPTIEWHHPDGPDPGDCPSEPVHVGVITVVVRGSAGTIDCEYLKGSASTGPGENVKCEAVNP
jgi:hypothetical protein